MAVAPQLGRHQPNLPSKSRMPSLFNTIRASIYGTVLLFTVICLAMAGHFQTVLAASDLTRFVPFAIFVCTVSLLIFVILLSFSYLLRERNPISTRIELASLGLAGMFWLVLGVFLLTSESQDAAVECYSEDEPGVLLDDEMASFHTDQFQAMYRVLNAFALINAALVLGSCFILLFLAWRKHRNGDTHMWHGPVTSCAWFNSYSAGKPVIVAKPPVKPGKQRQPSMSALLPTTAPPVTTYTARPQRRAVREATRRTTPAAQAAPAAAPAPPPFYPTIAEAKRSYSQRSREHGPRTRTTNNPYFNPAQYANAPLPALPRQSRRHGPPPGTAKSATAVDYEAGMMANPYSNRAGGSGPYGTR